MEQTGLNSKDFFASLYLPIRAFPVPRDCKREDGKLGVLRNLLKSFGLKK